MIEVLAIQCPECKDTIYSRAHHDMRECSCGNYMIDGGFSYTRCGSVKGFLPKIFKIKIEATEKDLYNDWRFDKNKFGVIKND